jgi:hypothetical protein
MNCSLTARLKKFEKIIEGEVKMTNNNLKDEDLAWDERRLGADPQYVRVADESYEISLNQALGLSGQKTNAPKDAALAAATQQK